MEQQRPRVILVTDGDIIARTALEIAASLVHARVISRSAGNPTPLAGATIADLVLHAAHDPVIVMLDDNGTWGQGPGEQALRSLVQDRRIRIIGVLAVASNTRYVRGVKVDFSIDRRGRIVDAAVNKYGFRLRSKRKFIFGDTVDILRRLRVPCLIGIGDIGKMKGLDDRHRGCPVTVSALRLLIELDEFSMGDSRNASPLLLVQ
ncbi:MAG: stage V sporulation protein AE [Acidibacillus sp.]|uniref:Stage V sporulation protein AE n=1 Tax=Sulfoacidibacillus ferrooxidans TaxID=2005001 RepID=A0A9X1VA72_9BACL|nr:stage V sporulation protein AE [Sulfoacidibacillus ferrooxidans]MCI0184094.1 hypothetical protein [Sulfoacidibacillus ferrooxidans]MCY0893044.1 stage V sporulation protein AE [Acidibacillus sp.]